MTHITLRRRAAGISATVFLLLLTAVAPAQQRLPDGQYLQKLEYKADGNPQRVNVAGDFNNWSSDANPMTREGDAWRASVPMSEGVHHYKFVIDGNKWVNDPKADKSLEEGDNYGGVNSGVFAGPDGRKLPKPQPNAINRDAVSHDQSDLRDLDVVSSNLLLLAVRVQADDVQKALVHVQPEGGRDATYELSKTSSLYGFDRFGALIDIKAPRATYKFELVDGSKSENVAGGTVEMTPTFQTPEWAKHAVWYQIFPERFRNGDSANDPGDKDYEHLVKWTSNWWKAQPGEEPGDENFYKGVGNVWKRRYGGDVQGLKWSLPYLRELGINAIYLNPMFEADSMHKYDATDYRHIDDNFGVKGDIDQLQGETDDPATWKWTKTDKLFLDFVAEAHKQGFKVILDGVFNHVGRHHWAFGDVLKNGKNSKYADWFDVRDWNPPIKYIAWDRGSEPSSDGALPVFKKDPSTGLAPGPRKHIIEITKRWLAPDGDPSKGVDGWRLDVPGDIPHPFWIEWRKVVKSAKPDAYISGEIWTWAQPWLQGDQFDAVMNYRFANAAQQFFVNQKSAIPPTAFSSRLLEMAFNYPYQVSLVQQNLFDSHDTDRFASMFVNPDVGYDAANRIQDNNPKYSPAKPTPLQRKRMLQAVEFQMAFVGAPMIYYGDETGMWSPDDPSNRQPMVWRDLEPYEDLQVKFDAGVFETYQRAIAARAKTPALQAGFFNTILADDKTGVYGFERSLGDDKAFFVLNRSGEARSVKVPVGAVKSELVNLLDPAQAKLVKGDDGRPEVKVIKTTKRIEPKNGVCIVEIGPYGSVLLTGTPQKN